MKQLEIPFLRYTSKAINKKFRIKASGIFHGVNYHNYIGVSTAVKIMGLYIFNELCETAFSRDKQKIEIQVNRDFKVGFYQR